MSRTEGGTTEEEEGEGGRRWWENTRGAELGKVPRVSEGKDDGKWHTHSYTHHSPLPSQIGPWHFSQ